MKNRIQTSPVEHSNVIVFPPVIPITGFLLGVAIEQLLPLASRIPDPARGVVRGVGSIVFCMGAAGFAWMVAAMKRAGTPIHNTSTPTALVENGPFRYTRNPMYLFGSVAYAGLALLLLQPWSLAMLPLVFATTHYGVVLREEAFLERHFGAAYEQYRTRVRRWL